MSANFDFTNVSMLGRFAYAVMCAERYALAKYPNKDWRRLFKWMWSATSELIDVWYYRFLEVVPEYLFEFKDYESSAFDYLSKNDYTYYSELLKDIDCNMARLITIPAEIPMVYPYMTIPGKGQDITELVEEAIKILEDNNIELPDFNEVTFSKFSEKNGDGENFDGTRLSVILNK